MKLAGVECLLSFQLSWALENTLRLEVDVLRAFASVVLYSAGAQLCVCIASIFVYGVAASVSLLFLLAPFFSWCTCVAPVALQCIDDDVACSSCEYCRG
uniref:Uncharacterized protein n=1 Tax=Rhipicephalus microplus TaxID=6941 RepID=A0A6G5A183_RHIMP